MVNLNRGLSSQKLNQGKAKNEGSSFHEKLKFSANFTKTNFIKQYAVFCYFMYVVGARE
jgi:hypothetical protein